MDAKLKTLTVPVLKEIISKANLSVPGKAKKPDLIQKILESPDAIAVYEAEYGDKKSSAPAKQTAAHAAPAEQAADELSPLEDSATPQPPKPQSRADASDGSATLSTAATPTTKPADISAAALDASQLASKAGDAPTEDEETAKRRVRAERFGIPFVEKPLSHAKAGKEAQGKGGPKAAKAEAKQSDAPEKLKARAARFGLESARAANGDAKEAPKAATNGKKRGAPADEPVDPEELERRKRRAERFGGPVVGAAKA